MNFICLPTNVGFCIGFVYVSLKSTLLQSL